MSYSKDHDFHALVRSYKESYKIYKVQKLKSRISEMIDLKVQKCLDTVADVLKKGYAAIRDKYGYKTSDLIKLDISTISDPKNNKDFHFNLEQREKIAYILRNKLNPSGIFVPMQNDYFYLVFNISNLFD